MVPLMPDEDKTFSGSYVLVENLMTSGAHMLETSITYVMYEDTNSLCARHAIFARRHFYLVCVHEVQEAILRPLLRLQRKQ